jgi:hypothetical protein
MRRICFLVPALLLACQDSNSNSAPESAGNSTAPAFKQLTPSFSQATTFAAGPAPHNPQNQIGSQISCFDGPSEGTIYGGACNKFASGNGAELKTNDGDPDGSYAGIYVTSNIIAGRLLVNMGELRYSYAGGPFAGGAPRWSVAIDEDGDGTFEAGEVFAFADAGSCNDGDSNVGVSDAQDDVTCTWFYKAEVHPNWRAFSHAHPNSRIPRRNSNGTAMAVPAFVITDAPNHYLVWNVAVN